MPKDSNDGSKESNQPPPPYSPLNPNITSTSKPNPHIVTSKSSNSSPGVSHTHPPATAIHAAATETHAFPSLPIARYDTMTSYQEDGTATIQPAQNLPMGSILDQPVRLQCPFCHELVVTKTSSTTGCLTWLSCFGLMAIGCVSGCCLLPWCVRGLKDIEHYCPNCRSLIAIYKRI